MFLFIQSMHQQRKDIINCLARHFHGNMFDSIELGVIENDFLKPPAVVVHCKAGKGRTGLIICCFLLFTEIFDNVEEAIAHYNKIRTSDGHGLTIDSQIRQVYHFKHFIDQTCVDVSDSAVKP